MTKARRIKVTGVRRADGEDVEMLGLVLWLQAKRILRERRANEAAARRKRKKIEGENER